MFWNIFLQSLTAIIIILIVGTIIARVLTGYFGGR